MITDAYSRDKLIVFNDPLGIRLNLYIRNTENIKISHY